MAVSYWCIPRTEDAPEFSMVIKSIAEGQDAPIFRPHLTLGTLKIAEANIDNVVSALEGLVLSPVEIGSSEEFTKSLFVRFEASRKLLAARTALQEMSGFRSGRTFDPHISLCYGPPPNGGIVSSFVKKLLSRPVRFDRLVAMDISLPVDSYDDIAAWTELKTYQT